MATGPAVPPLCVLRERFHRNLDLAFYLRLAQSSPGTVLELGAGAGRVSHALAGEGVRVLCVERDPECAAVARERAAQHGVRMRVRVHDATDVRAEERFGLVIGPSFFEHLTDPGALAAVLAQVRPNLLAGGRVAVRVATRAYPLSVPLSEQVATLADGTPIRREFWTEPGDDPDVVHARFRYRVSGDGDGVMETLAIRRWDVAELCELAAGAGYRVAEEYGDFAGAPLVSESAFALFVLEPEG